MSELMSPVPELEPNPMSIPNHRNLESAEIIDFEKSSAELVTGKFLTDLQAAVEEGEAGVKLAERIDHDLSPQAENDTSPHEAHLIRLVEAGAFENDEIYDHKAEHDPVFRKLIEKLQSTQKFQHELRDQRLAARKLIRLRASLAVDETGQDDVWNQVIDRLFGRPQ